MTSSKTLTDMTLFRSYLADIQSEVEGGTGPDPKPKDLVSISDFQSYVEAMSVASSPNRRCARISASAR